MTWPLRVQLTVALGAVVCGAGCVATLRYPLCPALAPLSYPAQHSDEERVSLYVADQAKQRGITISVLSPFVAELAGSKGQLRWFDASYRFMLCSFDHSREADYAKVYSACISNTGQWMTTVRSTSPDALLQPGNGYAGVCLKE